MEDPIVKRGDKVIVIPESTTQMHIGYLKVSGNYNNIKRGDVNYHLVNDPSNLDQPTIDITTRGMALPWTEEREQNYVIPSGDLWEEFLIIRKEMQLEMTLHEVANTKGKSKKPKINFVQSKNSVLIEFNTKIKGKRQLSYFNKLIEKDVSGALTYLNTFGGKKDKQPVDRFAKKGFDKLKDKRKNTVFAEYNKLITPCTVWSPKEQHKPGLREDMLGKWVGVELEVLIPKSLLGAGERRCVCNQCDNYDDGENNEDYCGPCGCDREDCGCGYCHGDSDMEEIGHEPAAKKYFSEKFKEAKVKRASIKEDSSIKGPNTHIGLEATVVTLLSDLSPIDRICKVLKAADCKINKTCGLHIHLDCRDLRIEADKVVKRKKNKLRSNPLFAAVDNGFTPEQELDMKIGRFSPRKAMTRAKCLFRALEPLALMVPPTRFKEVDGFTAAKKELSTVDGNRYSAINGSAIKKFQTVEVRFHSGTTSFLKISMWIHILYKISRAKLVTELRSLAELKRAVPSLSVDELNYILRRAELFNPDLVTLEDKVALTGISDDIEVLVKETMAKHPLNYADTDFVDNSNNQVTPKKKPLTEKEVIELQEAPEPFIGPMPLEAVEAVPLYTEDTETVPF